MMGYMSVTPRTNGHTSAHTVPLPRTVRAQTRRTVRTQITIPTTSTSTIKAQASDLAITYGFYGAVLAVALTGATQATAGQLDWPVLPSAVACGVVELGGVVFSHHADNRRSLGEAAIPSRMASAAVAVGAVAVNYFGHTNIFQACFFAGMSALGYAAYLVKSGAKYRDAMRAAGKMTSPAPAYGIWQTMRHPLITRAARILAIQDPSLGTIESLNRARNAKRDADRQAAIATAVRRQIADRVDPVMAEIAVLTYDMDRIARNLAAGADYAGLTRIISSQLTAQRIAPRSDEGLSRIEAIPELAQTMAIASKSDMVAPIKEQEKPAESHAKTPETKVEAPALPRDPAKPKDATDVREQLAAIDQAFPNWRTTTPTVRELSNHLGAKSNTPGVKLRRALIEIKEHQS